MLYEQFFIDDLKERADLVRIIEPYAPLKKKGQNWMGRCPFHQEKTPSFSVNPAKGFYKCFGCGKGGNAYTFLMEIEGLTFPEAIVRVAEISGVTLPEPIDDKDYAKNKKRQEEKKDLALRVVELNKAAIEFWENELSSNDPKAKAAREYLASRGISEEVQKVFRIGFSRDSWDSLLNHLKTITDDQKLIEQSGLVSVNEEKKRVFDRFRGRIMFPVLDVNGSPVAFGARAMGDDQPKYLNSPETPAYVKGRHLYGLFQSKDAIRRKKFAIIVEGYLDLIALHQFGITNVVASLGTAFTPDQSRLLKRFTKQAVVNYDGDSAGINAARRAVEILIADDFGLKVLTLPGGNDPDDFIREYGAAEYEKLRGKAQPFLEFILDASMSGRNIHNAKHKAEATEEVLPILAKIANPVQKRTSFDQAMDFYRIEDAGLRRDLWTVVKGAVTADPRSFQKAIKRATGVKATLAEEQLLELMIYDPELRSAVLPLLEESDFEQLASAAIFRAFIKLDPAGGEITREQLLEAVAGDEFCEDYIPLLMTTEPKREPGDDIEHVMHAAENCIVSLRVMAITDRVQEVSREAQIAEQAGDIEQLKLLTLEVIELQKMKHDLLNKISNS